MDWLRIRARDFNYLAVTPALRDLEERAATAFGRSDPLTFDVRHRVLVAAQQAGQDDEVLRLARALHRDATRALPPEDPMHIRSIGLLAVAYMNTHDLEKALPLTRTAYEMAEEHLGPDHATTLSWLNNYGSTLRLTGDLDAAIAVMREGADRRARVFGLDNSWSHYGRLQLAGALVSRADSGDHAEAATLLGDILRLRADEDPYEVNHLNTRVLLSLAERSTGDPEAADARLAKIEIDAEAALAMQKPPVPWLLLWHRHLVSLDRATEAAAFGRELVDRVESTYGKASPELVHVTRTIDAAGS